MKVLGIIPVRYGSRRLPGKPLLNINGLPMVVCVYRQAIQTEGLAQVRVATDDTRIAEVLKAHQVPYSMTSSAHPNGTFRCWEAYTQQQESYDFLINIQGDEPFLHPKQLEVLIDLLKRSPKLQIGTLIKQITDPELIESPHTVKVVCDTAGRALYFSRSPIRYALTDPKQTPYYKHIGLYAYSPTILEQLVALPESPLEKAESLEQLRWLSHGYSIHTTETQIESISIDTPEDLAWAKKQGLLKK